MRTAKARIIFIVIAMMSSSIFLMNKNAFALPAFALREKANCNLCHANGSVPHLTKTGYLYRRSGYRFPGDIGNVERDEQAMYITQHLAAGINVDYEFETNKSSGSGQTARMTSNQFDVREIEVWPLVGGFKGNFGSFSEIDGNIPTTLGTTNNGAGTVVVSHADLRYVRGDADMFFNFRVGLITTEGYGASDQWIDDGNLPLFDQLSAQYFDSNAGKIVDTLVTPLGANNMPQLGAELGLNYHDSHLTFGIFNGFDGTASAIGTTAVGTANTPVATANLMKQTAKGTKDFKVQLDQFLLDDKIALTGIYYHGTTGLLNPASTGIVWNNHYTNWRLYLTVVPIPQTLDLLAGFGTGTYEMLNSATSVVWNVFHNEGFFIGANYYVMPHLTLSGHLDEYQFSSNLGAKVLGYSLMASMPFSNNHIFIFHYNSAVSDNPVFAGNSVTSNQFRAEWRFLF